MAILRRPTTNLRSSITPTRTRMHPPISSRKLRTPTTCSPTLKRNRNMTTTVSMADQPVGLSVVALVEAPRARGPLATRTIGTLSGSLSSSARARISISRGTATLTIATRTGKSTTSIAAQRRTSRKNLMNSDASSRRTSQKEVVYTSF